MISVHLWLKHWCVISVTLVTNFKHGTIRSAVTVNSIPVRPSMFVASCRITGNSLLTSLFMASSLTPWLLVFQTVDMFVVKLSSCGENCFLFCKKQLICDAYLRNLDKAMHLFYYLWLETSGADYDYCVRCCLNM